MKKILVSTDFSPAALNAAMYAAHMAQAIHADIVLFHVYAVPVVYSEVPIAVNIEDIRLAAEENMSQLAAQLKKETNGEVLIGSEIRMGAYYEELKKFCKFLNPYTVVMGSQGTSARDRLLFGSHSVHAIRHLNWPLITVPATATFSAIKKIGLARSQVKFTLPGEFRQPGTAGSPKSS